MSAVRLRYSDLRVRIGRNGDRTKGLEKPRTATVATIGLADTAGSRDHLDTRRPCQRRQFSYPGHKARRRREQLPRHRRRASEDDLSSRHDRPGHIAHNIAVEIIEPDLDTLSWSIDEEFEGGTQVANVELIANINFDGYVHKSVGYHLHDARDSDISVVDIDWNDQKSRVSFARRATLVFHGVLHPDLPAVDNLEFVEASDASHPLPDPHV